MISSHLFLSIISHPHYMKFPIIKVYTPPVSLESYKSSQHAK